MTSMTENLTVQLDQLRNQIPNAVQTPNPIPIQSPVVTQIPIAVPVHSLQAQSVCGTSMSMWRKHQKLIIVIGLVLIALFLFVGRTKLMHRLKPIDQQHMCLPDEFPSGLPERRRRPKSPPPSNTKKCESDDVYSLEDDANFTPL
jgi:hypothetical protein